MLSDAEEPATPAYDIDGSDLTHGDPHTVRSKDPRAVATDPHPTRGSGVNSSFSNGVRYGRTVPFIVRKGIANSRPKEILVQAVSTEDPEVRGMRRVIAASYEKLARR